MMQVTKIDIVEDCLDGSMIIDIFFTQTISKSFIDFLGNWGKLEYFAHFPRPFFRVTKSRQYSLKGVLGNNKIQVVFFNDREIYQAELLHIIEQFIE